jgi:hypothetical protein
MKFVPQSLTDELQEHCVTSCKDLPRSVEPFTCSHLLRYWGGALGISVHCWNKPSEHGVVNRIACKGWGTNHFWTLFMSKQFFPEGKNIKFCYRCLKVYWSMFWEGGHNFESGGGHLRFLLRDSTRAHSAMIMKCMLASCGMLAISHPLYSPFLVLLTFSVLESENLPWRNKISGHREHQ